MLLHRLFWPVIERPLYAVQRYAVEKKEWLWVVGAALLFHRPGLRSFLSWVVTKLFDTSVR
jgi:hypothetical protein